MADTNARLSAEALADGVLEPGVRRVSTPHCLGTGAIEQAKEGDMSWPTKRRADRNAGARLPGGPRHRDLQGQIAMTCQGRP